MSSLLDDDDELIQEDSSSFITTSVATTATVPSTTTTTTLPVSENLSTSPTLTTESRIKSIDRLNSATVGGIVIGTSEKVSSSPLSSQIINILSDDNINKSPSLVPEVDDCIKTIISTTKQHKRIKSADDGGSNSSTPTSVSSNSNDTLNTTSPNLLVSGQKPPLNKLSSASSFSSSTISSSTSNISLSTTTSSTNTNTNTTLSNTSLPSIVTTSIKPSTTTTTTTTSSPPSIPTSTNNIGTSKSLPVSPINSSSPPQYDNSFKSEPFLNLQTISPNLSQQQPSHQSPYGGQYPHLTGNQVITNGSATMTSPLLIHAGSNLSNSSSFNRNRTNSNSVVPNTSLTSSIESSTSNNNNNNPKRKESLSKKNKSPTITSQQANNNLNVNNNNKEKSSGPIMQFLGKMSLSKERMSKLVSQAKEAYKGQPGSPLNNNIQTNGNNVNGLNGGAPFEGIFGIPLRVILRYQSESGNQIPSILNNLFSQLESSTSLSTSQIFMLPPQKSELDHLRQLYDNGADVNLKTGFYSPHLIAELLIEFFTLLPEPIIPVEFYETVLNYYQTETLLHLMIRRMQNPNRAILFRLIRYLKDVLVYANFNEVTLDLLVERFHRFILRPTIGTVSTMQLSDQHQQAIKDIVSMFIQQVDTLFQSSEERTNPDDSLILYIEEVQATTSQKLVASLGNLWLFHKQIVWRPKVNSTGEPDLVIPFNSILKVVLTTHNRKESLKSLPNFTIYCSSETKTVITFTFQSASTCKLTYAYTNSVTKSISNSNRIQSQKLDLYNLELENLPTEIKQLKHLQDLNLGKNKFKLIPGDLARLVSLRTISIEENNLSEISTEMADFIGSRLPHLENVSLSNNRLVVIPPLYTWMKLKTLNISNNYLTKLPIDIFQIPTLEVLRASNNQIDDNGIPKVITSTKLRSLDLRKNLLQTIPEGIINLVELQVLTLQENQIQELTPDIQKLTALTELNLNSNQISLLPSQLLLLTNLKKLYLDNNQIQTISSAIHRMQSLIELRFTNNNISRLPPGIVALKKLNSLELTGNKPLRDNIPEKYIAKGKEGIFAYFSEAMRTNVPCYRTRIIVLGEKASGKSNLIKCLKKMPKSSFTPQNTSPTNVLDIQDWQCSLIIDGLEGKKKKSVITVHLWEFEGMTNEISHVFFVGNIIYTVCFNVAQYSGSESSDQKLISYLYRISQKDRKATIILVGTHLDEITTSRKYADRMIDNLVNRLRSVFPNFQLSLFLVSSTKSDGDGIRKLRHELKSIISKMPILRQTYPASFMFLEDYLKEESNLMSPPLVNKKTLQQMARTMELHNEPHFSQLKSLFNSLGSIQCFEQFIRMEPCSPPMKTEMISLNPIWIARAIAALVCFDPYRDLPYLSAHGKSESDQELSSTIQGILPHRVLRYVWGTNSQYYVPEGFFSLFLSLLESNDLAINIYSLAEQHHHSHSISSTGSSISSSTSNDNMLSIINQRRRISSVGGMTNFNANQKVRNGRSSSFNARFGWALVSSLLPAYGKPLIPGQFELAGVWDQFPERSDIIQFTRRFKMDFIPNGLFGRLLSRLMQVTNLLKCWNNIALLVPDQQSNPYHSERILVLVDHDSNTIEVSTRLIKPSNLSCQIYNIFDSLISKWYKLTFKTMVLCSHCLNCKHSNPYYFKLEDCESNIFRGEKNVYCQWHTKAHQQADVISNGSNSSSTSTPKLSRKESIKEMSSSSAMGSSGSLSGSGEKSNRRDSKGPLPLDRKDSSSSIGSMSLSNSNNQLTITDLSQPVAIKSLLLDHYVLCEFIKEIDFKEIEVVHSLNSESLVSDNNGPTTQSMGMRGNQFVNIKIFNSPTSEHSGYSKIMSLFRHEVLSLYTFRHPNVLSIIGVTWQPVAIITENPTFGNKGSTMLSEYIQDRQKHPEIPWNIKLKIALDIAKAMERLQSHSPPFLMTNLSSQTVILEKLTKHQQNAHNDHHDSTGIVAKISDFSSSSLLPSLFPTDQSPKPWQAPEVLQKLNYHELTDSYSFGIILYELLTRSIVFQDHERFGSMIISGQRPPIPPDCLQSFADLIKDCWSAEPLNRPTFSNIISQLVQIRKELESKENNHNSLSSDTNIYSNNLPLPSGGSVMFQDKIIHFGGWNTSKPHSNVYALNLSSLVFEDKLSVVLSNKQSTTYRAFYQHMQTEYNEENLIFFEAIKTFKSLPNQTPQDRETIKSQAKKIYEAFIGSNSPREINLPFNLKMELKKKIESADGPSVTVFNDTLAFVISSIDDSFHRFKFSAPNHARNGWVKIEVTGTSPPPMVGHSSVLWSNQLVVVGGWFNGSRQMNQVYLLNLETYEWQTHQCTGDIPPSSTGAINSILYGDYLLIYYERADSPKQQIFRLSLDSFVWFVVKYE
ncbi:Kelch repeat-containing protein [Tieghemostelium lacteum]|uniref:Kelch repeat-containing protein n=1 Tax=Tieghemostelium lacteum TaxID=361077 RepID=A0A152A1D6_TIELA|nr:Kelch repeat-containing protein [Tieghemostelium lacteum]|eukprot:KYR00058.1 Kelch repeat-containing protein [Tieghemostelium lacteum]